MFSVSIRIRDHAMDSLKFYRDIENWFLKSDYLVLPTVKILYWYKQIVQLCINYKFEAYIIFCFSGPTSFAPMIETAMSIVESSGGQYHVLLIIADGQVR